MRRIPWLVVLLLMGLAPAEATIEIGKKEKKACTVCHVKMGAKELNEAGKYYQQHKTLAGYPPAAPSKAARPQPPATPATPATPAKPAPPAKPAAPAEPAPAPEAPERELFLVVREKIDPPQVQVFEEVVKEWVAQATKANLGPEFSWQAVQRNPFTYSFIWPLTDLNALDPASAVAQARKQKVTEAVGAERMKGLEAKAAPAIRSSESWIVESVPGLSYVPAQPPPGPARVIQVSREQARYEMVQEYEAVVERFLELLREGDFPFPISAYRNLTGPVNTYYYVLGAPDRSSLVEGYRFFEEELPKLAGKEGVAKLFAEWGATLADFESFEEDVRGDLSYMPKP